MYAMLARILIRIGKTAIRHIIRFSITLAAVSIIATAQPGFVCAAQFSICEEGARRINCVVDGDTFWMDGVKIRIADIDAPETHPARCAHEQQLGDAATQRLRDLLNAGPFELDPIDRDEDVYGRKLRIVDRDSRSIGAEMVKEGLAREWDGSRKPWCG